MARVGIAGSFPELAACIDGLIAEREQAGEKAAPGLLTVMVQARGDDGWSIGAHHIRTLVVNMLSGSLSASFMLGNLLYRLLSDRDFDSALRNDSEKIPLAVEESLRLEAPVTFLFRTAHQESEIGGCPVHKGEHVMLSMAAANRDEEAYPDAEQFRLDRDSRPEHLSFGIGPHICLGNHLTRIRGFEESLVVFRATLRLHPVVTTVKHDSRYGNRRLRN